MANIDNEGPEYAILLLNLGGPSSLNDIQPFLYQLFSDKDIISFPIPFLQTLFASLFSKFRAPKTAEYYSKIGGSSPILSLTIKQQEALEKELQKTTQCKVYIGMRYSNPSIADAINDIKKNLPKNLVIFPLYPQFSTTTTLSSLNELKRVMDNQNLYIPTITIKEWFDCPDYITALSHLICEKLKTFENKDQVHLVFSAHSLPMSVVAKGDPYSEQINGTVKGIMKELGIKNPYHVCYQSKVGPIKWLEPSTASLLKTIAMEKDQELLMIPISFVSDHFETDYEIDILYAEQAKALGIKEFKRISSLNDHPLFIKALSNLVLEHINLGLN